MNYQYRLATVYFSLYTSTDSYNKATELGEVCQYSID